MNPVRIQSVLVATLVAASLANVAAARAHGTHDDAAPRAGASAAMPRLVAESETFELVGVLERGDTLRLWLDRWSDNTPVHDARIELEIGESKLVATPAKDAPGYVAMLASPLAEGVFPVAAVIVAGNETDLLAGELDVHGAATTAADRPTVGTGLSASLSNLPRSVGVAITAAFIAAIGSAALFLRARRTRRSLR